MALAHQQPLAHRAVATVAAVTDKRSTFGRSVHHRALRVTRRGAADEVIDVLVVGVIHGNERAGLQIVRRLEQVEVPQDIRLWIVPSINPDGARANTRQNARGVDLNRNFPHRWQHSGNRWNTYYPGPRVRSEPETRATINLIGNIKPDLTIWYHQHMNIVVRPSGSKRRRVARRYATVSHMTVKGLAALRGTAVGWQNATHSDSTAMVIELPAGSLTSRAVTRHVRAVFAAARISD
jgi:protein MpaA